MSKNGVGYAMLRDLSSDWMVCSFPSILLSRPYNSLLTSYSQHNTMTPARARTQTT